MNDHNHNLLENDDRDPDHELKLVDTFQLSF